MPQLPNPNIALSGTHGGNDSGGTLGTLGQMMRIKEQFDVYRQRQQQRQQQQRELEDDNAIRTTLPKYDRPDEAIDDLYKQGRAEAAAKLGTSIYHERKAKAEAYDAQLVSAGKRLAQAGQIAQGITDDATYQPARRALVELLTPLYGDGINDTLPTTYDPKQMKALIAAGTTRANQITAEHNAATELQTAFDKGIDRVEKFTKIGSNLLSTATSKDQWDGYMGTLYGMGAPKPVLTSFGDWDDADPTAAPKRAGKFGLSGKEEADIARTADRDKVLKEQGEERNRIAARRALATAQAAREGGGGRGSTLTAGRQSEVDERHNKRVEAAEKTFKDSVGNMPGATDEEKAKAKADLVAAKLRAADDLRKESGKLRFDDAAEDAIDKGDRAAYDKLEKEYNKITGGSPAFSAVAPWRGKATAPTSASLKALRAEFATATPARKAEITKELKALTR